MAVPNHVAFIVDGNRRWAREKGLPPFEGHRIGFNRVLDVTDYLLKTEVRQVTYYLFSTENWKRAAEEVNYLMNLATSMVERLLDPWAAKNIRVRHLGRKDPLPLPVLDALNRIQAKTERNTGLVVNLAINYGGRAEIVDAFNSLVLNGIPESSITEQDITKHLYNPNTDPVDVVVRTSGEQRISNFLIWQAAYAELIFLNKFWPDMTEADVQFVLDEFERRQRRFGA